MSDIMVSAFPIPKGSSLPRSPEGFRTAILEGTDSRKLRKEALLPQNVHPLAPCTAPKPIVFLLPQGA